MGICDIPMGLIGKIYTSIKVDRKFSGCVKDRLDMFSRECNWQNILFSNILGKKRPNDKRMLNK